MWMTQPPTTSCIQRLRTQLGGEENSPRNQRLRTHSERALLKNGPDITAHLPNLQFIEMHDPTDCSQGSNDQPYAYLADRVQIGALDADMHEIMLQGSPSMLVVALDEGSYTVLCPIACHHQVLSHRVY